MKLIKIDKARYRSHLNKVIISCIAALVVGSLSIAQTLIALFPDSDGSHFHWNLSGVVVTATIIGVFLHKVRSHDFMIEVTYVWDLKQALNKVTRKMLKLKPAAEQGNVKAMLALQFSYAGSRLLWELDDNTIVMDELAIEQAKLDALAKKYQVTLSADQYELGFLDEF